MKDIEITKEKPSKKDACKEDHILENIRSVDNFFENIYEQMNLIDQHHHDMGKMMNSLRGFCFDNDQKHRYFSPKSIFDYDIRKSKNFNSIIPKTDTIFREYKSVPPVDIMDKDKEIEIKLDIPGLSKENVHINLCDGHLEISGSFEKAEERKGEEGRYYVKERMQSSFRRSFALPENVSEDNIKATFKDGVLKVDIPKKEVSNRRKIEIL